jgi:hypothetical protein
LFHCLLTWVLVEAPDHTPQRGFSAHRRYQGLLPLYEI